MRAQSQKKYLSTIINEEEYLKILIYDDLDNNIGMMRPFTLSDLNSHEIIKKITSWRNKYKLFFLTQFQATPYRTKKWLEKVVLVQQNQLMFLIYNKENLIGHYGFKDLDKHSAFLDNAMRGERGGHPMLMKYAAIALMKWLFNVMCVDEIYGYTFANNAMGLRLNKELGFDFVDKYPLHKQAEGNEVKWIIGKAGESSSDNHYYQKIVLNRNSKMGRLLTSQN